MLEKMLSKTARERTFTSIWLALSEGHQKASFRRLLLFKLATVKEN